MEQFEQDKLYRAAAFCFALACVVLLVTGLIGGFETVNLVLTVLFGINAVLFFTVDRVKRKIGA